MEDGFFMHRCLELAAKGRGSTGTNPLVGAVLVRGEKIIAEAWHEQFGAVHAERKLLKNFDQKISSEDVLFVNVEPCCHQGKTPPCTDIVIERGVRYVVYGMRDPNPAVAGKGIVALRAAGVAVRGPVIPTECRRLNRGFLSLHEQGRPWITLKRAQTRDGKIAQADGSRMCITSDAQNAWSHTWLRSTHDAILVGVGTVLSDDPELTVRLDPARDPALPQPYRVILDPSLRTPIDARVIGPRTIIVTAPPPLHHSPESGEGTGMETRQERIQASGALVLEIPLVDSYFDWQQLWTILTTSQRDFHGISSILVEGGAETWRAFEEAALVDEEVTLVG